jgi:hypothetical protein
MEGDARGRFSHSGCGTHTAREATRPPGTAEPFILHERLVVQMGQVAGKQSREVGSGHTKKAPFPGLSLVGAAGIEPATPRV